MRNGAHETVKNMDIQYSTPQKISIIGNSFFAIIFIIKIIHRISKKKRFVAMGTWGRFELCVFGLISVGAISVATALLGINGHKTLPTASMLYAGACLLLLHVTMKHTAIDD